MLKQRVISAVGAILVLALAVYTLETPQLRWIVLAVWTLGAWEWSGFVQKFTTPLRLVFTVCLFIPMLLIAMKLMPMHVVHALFAISVLFWFFAFYLILTFPKEFSVPVIVLSGLLVIVPSYAAFDFLLTRKDLWYVLILLLMIWAADVGAYFSGKSFGKNKLAPKVSPGKTREGAVGGLILSLVVSVVSAKFLLQLEWWQAIKQFHLIAIAVVISSVVGDLTVSMFKRNADLKDSGVFLPGHGGVMDRVDSLCAGVVFFVMCITLFNVGS